MSIFMEFSEDVCLNAVLRLRGENIKGVLCVTKGTMLESACSLSHLLGHRNMAKTMAMAYRGRDVEIPLKRVVPTLALFREDEVYISGSLTAAWMPGLPEDVWITPIYAIDGGVLDELYGEKWGLSPYSFNYIYLFPVSDIIKYFMKFKTLDKTLEIDVEELGYFPLRRNVNLKLQL